MKKPFGLGIAVGRFQTFHNGHKDMIDKALGICEQVGIFIGSSQESGTLNNPFTYETREHFIKSIYGDTVKIFPLPDIGVGNTYVWGKYVLDNAEEKFGKKADIFITGKEGRRVEWFEFEGGKKVSELYIPKKVEVSASEMREYLLKGDFESWKSFVHQSVWQEFDSLRRIVLASSTKLETSSI